MPEYNWILHRRVNGFDQAYAKANQPALFANLINDLIDQDLESFICKKRGKSWILKLFYKQVDQGLYIRIQNLEVV